MSDKSTIQELIEAVMFYTDAHVADAGVADNIISALHGISDMIASGVKLPPRYEDMLDRARNMPNVEPVQHDGEKKKLYCFVPACLNEQRYIIDGSSLCEKHAPRFIEGEGVYRFSRGDREIHFHIEEVAKSVEDNDDE